MLQQFYKTQSATVSVQDGEYAGQTVKHVHAHVIPRKKGDFSPPDKIYNELEIESPTRKPRVLKEMEDEATSYRKFMKETSNLI
ncbi:Nitrilase and fragile histidine triad fusion protein NitFhit [Aphelenchoides bicaudatus]|nr:Nitrilase and fragile histidine triad fusion protein NitFhit [Aphelenchoides bicaudatus]